MIRIEVFAPAICNFDRISREGYMEIQDGTTLREVLKVIKLPLIWRKLSFITVNSEKVDKDYVMRDGDVLSIFTPVAGG